MISILVGRKEAARRVGVSLTYFDALRQAGIIPGPIVGVKYRWLDVERAMLNLSTPCEPSRQVRKAGKR